MRLMNRKLAPALLLAGFFGLGTASANGPVTHAEFSDSGRFLAASSVNRLDVWDLDGGEKRSFTFEHAAPITSFALTPAGDAALLTDDNGQITVVSIPDGKVLKTLSFASGNMSADISPNGMLFAVGNRRGKLFIGQTRTWEILREIPAHNFSVKAVAFSPDNRFVYTGGWDQLVKGFYF